jgi:hypothetical protein
MPVSTPDASAFTRLKKLSAGQAQTPKNTVEPLTHLYQPFIRSAGVMDFLSSTNQNKIYTGFTRQLPTTKVMTNNVGYIRAKYTR